jgi:hypothetical protein
MEIEIKQFDNQMRFIKDDRIIFYGDYVVSFFKMKRRFFNSKNKKIAEIKIKIGFRGIRFKIIFMNNNFPPVILKLKGHLIKSFFECLFLGKTFKIIKHKGHLTSIYEDDQQIAYYERSKVTSFGNQKISLICNSDINEELIYLFILALELTTQEQNEVVTFDLGNIGKEYKPFDVNWKPTN